MIPQNYPLQKMIEASQRMIMMDRQEGEELGGVLATANATTITMVVVVMLMLH